MTVYIVQDRDGTVVGAFFNKHNADNARPELGYVVEKEIEDNDE